MEQNQNLKTIKIPLDYADENGVRSTKEQTISVSNPVKRDKSKLSIYHQDSVYTLSFNVKIPEHIHSYLIGKSAPRRGGSDRQYEKKDFKKSISAVSIENLTIRWSQIINDFVYLKKFDSSDFKKVIFYNFKNKSKEYNSHWDGAYLGNESIIQHNFIVGYVVTVDGNHEKRYNKNKAYINDHYDREIYGYKYVEWTEEREAFFNNITNSFKKIIDKIDEFNDVINSGGINELMNKPLLLNNQ